MTIHFGGKFCFRERIKLVDEDDRGRGIFALFPLGFEFVPDLSGAKEHTSRGTIAPVGNDGPESASGQLGERRRRGGTSQHALGSHDHQRLAPRLRSACRAQHMKILRGRGWLADLDVIARRELQVPFDARARMLRPLPFVSMRKQHDDAGEQIPLVLARGDELIHDDLGAVCEIPKLRFPQNEGLGIIPAEAVFEAEDRGFGKRRIVDFEPGSIGRELFKRDILVLVLDIDQGIVPLVERASTGILPGEAHRNATLQQ